MSIARAHRGAFTLTELMIAVLVLVVVIVGTSKIFGTASKVTGLGQAASDVLQEVAAIEQRIRTDLENLSPEGFFMIRAVAVPNDVNSPGPLLNPVLPPNSWIRADQLIFFSQGAQTVQTMRVPGTYGRADDLKAQGAVSRVYYGHGFQLLQAGAAQQNGSNVDVQDAQLNLASPLVPWYSSAVFGPYNTVTTPFSMSAGSGDYTPTVAGSVDATQPPANRWLLTRQAVLLADDRDDFVVGAGADSFGSRYLSHHAALSIIGDGVDGVVLNGRVDVARTELNRIRQTVLDANSDFILDPWTTQRDTIAGALFYPRAERRAPSMHRLDTALTRHVLASACSSFIVDWTYENGVGFTRDPDSPNGPGFLGVGSDPALEQPWFGLDQAGDPSLSRQVQTYTDYFGNLPPIQQPQTVFPRNIEHFNPPDTTLGAAIQDRGAVVYEAIFGYNQQKPLDDDPTSADFQDPSVPLGYTPWPTAIRITMVLHDADGRMEIGREVQFVIALPRRVPN